MKQPLIAVLISLGWNVSRNFVNNKQPTTFNTKFMVSGFMFFGIKKERSDLKLCIYKCIM